MHIMKTQNIQIPQHNKYICVCLCIYISFSNVRFSTCTRATDLYETCSE